MKQNAAERALANIDAEIAVLQHARARIVDAMTKGAEPPNDEPKQKRGRPRRKAGLPSEPQS